MALGGAVLTDDVTRPRCERPSRRWSTSTARRRLDGPTSFLVALPERIDLELLVGHDPIQPGVLPLDVLEPLGVVGLHAAELVPPPGIGLLGHLTVPQRRDLCTFASSR
jgi:hypothetical protein